MHPVNKIMKQYINILTMLLPQLPTASMKSHSFGSSPTVHYFVNNALISTNKDLFISLIASNTQNYS